MARPFLLQNNPRFSIPTGEASRLQPGKISEGFPRPDRDKAVLRLLDFRYYTKTWLALRQILRRQAFFQPKAALHRYQNPQIYHSIAALHRHAANAVCDFTAAARKLAVQAFPFHMASANRLIMK